MNNIPHMLEKNKTIKHLDDFILSEMGSKIYTILWQFLFLCLNALKYIHKVVTIMY